jgi:hypothetical protein
MKSGISQKTLLTHEGGIRGKLRGNFECGSVQPSLLFSHCYIFQHIHVHTKR